jgi:hypothetical protein
MPKTAAVKCPYDEEMIDRTTKVRVLALGLTLEKRL